MNNLELELIKMKLEILKLRSNDHDWQCYVPEEIKKQIQKLEKRIDKEIKENK